jgi:hypothetical protein
MPGKNPPPGAGVDNIQSRVPTADDMVVISQPLLKTATRLAVSLKNNVAAKWALGGDAGETMMGVNVTSDHLEILTTKEGCEEICNVLKDYVTRAPAMAEKKLTRDADVEGKIYPVYVKSHYAELTLDGVKVEVYGDEQIKIGEWDWGDALDFTPDYTYLSGGKLPLVPLTLKSELDLGLGWLDRVALITDAILAKHHDH